MIEVRGVNFGNKGAQLMLTAIARHFAGVPDVDLASDHNVGTYKQRASLGLHQKVWFRKIGGWPGYLVPGKLRSRYGLVTDHEIDAVLDASGFAYSDQWGPCKSEYAAALCARWKKQGKKVILLPQAFGPFERKETRGAFARILANTDLVYARDQVSLDHAKSVGGPTAHVKVAPDFTNLIKGVLPDGFEPKPNLGAVIPNTRMIDKSADGTNAGYLPFLSTCVGLLKERGIEPFILIHETGDEELAKALREATSGVEIIREPDPERLKGILGACRLVVGSRFHGLVGSLSQGVPCLAAGWSHKYDELLSDYGCPECLASPSMSEDEIAAKLDAIISDTGRGEVIARLQSAGDAMKRQAGAMWAEVHSVLGL